MANSLFVAETVRRQHVAKKAVMIRNRKVKFFSLVTSLILCFSLLFVWTRIRVVQQGYDVSRLHKEVEDLAKQKSLLESEVAQLKSPAKLEAAAQGQLGMRLPHGDEIVFIEQ